MTVRLDRIVTRGGDKGQTSLGDGTRVAKSSATIEAIGTVDELNAQIGLLCSHMQQSDHAAELVEQVLQIQSCLFDLGSDLCLPDPTRPPSLNAVAVAWLEEELEGLRVQQAPLTSFILPGGSIVASQAHVVRTVTRRAERRVIALDHPPEEGVRFLNRLSDYFFVLSRHANGNGAEDVLWAPGRWKNSVI